MTNPVRQNIPTGKSNQLSVEGMGLQISDKAIIFCFALMMIIGLPFFLRTFTPSHFLRTVDQFEQWSVSHPVEASQVMNTSTEYGEILHTVTGEELEEDTRVFRHIPLDNGHYNLCLEPWDKDDDSYLYSSEKDSSSKVDKC